MAVANRTPRPSALHTGFFFSMGSSRQAEMGANALIMENSLRSATLAVIADEADKAYSRILISLRELLSAILYKGKRLLRWQWQSNIETPVRVQRRNHPSTKLSRTMKTAETLSEAHSTAVRPRAGRAFTLAMIGAAFTLNGLIVTPSLAQSELDEALAQVESDPAAQLIPGVWFQNLQAEIPMSPPAVFFAMNPDVVLPVSEGITGDFDGDGVQDMLLPGIPSNEEGAETQGRLIALSGWTGDLLFNVINAEFGDLFGSSFAHMNDLFGDGGDEIIVGAPLSSAGAAQAGKAYIVNGADGRLLYTITSDVVGAGLGLAVASAGDLNGDGLGDMMVSAPFDGTGKLFVFLSGAGLLLPEPGADPDQFYPQAMTTADADMVLTGEAPSQMFGISLANAADVSADGVDDLLIGAPHFDAPGTDAGDNRGRAYLYSGADGVLLGVITGSQSLQNLGYSVSSAGDLEADGRADLLIGAPGAESARGRGLLYLLDPGDPIPFTMSDADADFTFAPQDDAGAATIDDFFGMQVAAGNDVDGDGAAEFLVYARVVEEAAGTLAGVHGYVYSGPQRNFSTHSRRRTSARRIPRRIPATMRAIRINSASCFPISAWSRRHSRKETLTATDASK